MAYSHASVDRIPEYGEQKDASVPKLNFYNALTNLQKKRKNTWCSSKKMENIMDVYETKNGYAFFSRYGELELNICSFVLVYIFNLKLCLSTFLRNDPSKKRIDLTII